MLPGRYAALLATLLASGLVNATAGAQAPMCPGGNRLVRSGAGAVLGAFVAIVAWHVRYSDWSDEVKTPAGTRARNQAMLTGAVAGAVLANLPVGTRRCDDKRRPLTSQRDAAGVVTSAEIQKYGANGTVFDLVYARHRSWLNVRGLSLAETPSVEQDVRRGGRVTEAKEASLVVYLDNARLGDWEQLRSLPLTGVTEIRYYDAAQASQRWGPGHEHGVIQVLTTIAGTPK